jgi:aminopeptidase N
MMPSNKGPVRSAGNTFRFTLLLLLVLPPAAAARQARPNPFAPPQAKVQYAPDRDYDLQHVALDLDVDYARLAFRGVVVNTLAPLRDGLTAVTFHCGANLNVEACQVAGQDALFTREGDTLKVTSPQPLPRGQAVRVTVRYASGKEHMGFHWIRPTGNDLHRVGFYTEGATAGHPFWVPTWNYPNDFATSETRVTVPADWYVVGNGALESNALNPGGKTRTFHWKMDRPHATYLLSLVGGPFDVKTASWRDVPLLYTVPKGKGDLIEETFGETPDMLSFYSDLLGVKYPWPKYAQSAMHDYAGGMEWVTATLFGDSFLTERRMGPRMSSPAVAHELAHQWFGNLVTCRDWGHLWLNEGFAIFFGQMLYFEHWRGKDEYDHWAETLAQVYFGESRRYQRPLATNVYPSPGAMFDDHTYIKGGLVLHTLRRHLGDKAFFLGIRHYLTKYRHSPVDTHDFCQAMTEATGVNLEPFFDQWVLKPGHPVLDYRWTWDGAHGQVVLAVRQTQDTRGGTPVYGFGANVGLISGGMTRARVRIDKAEQEVRLDAPRRPDAVLLDPDHDLLRELPNLPWRPEELPHILKYAPNAVDRQTALNRMLEGTPSDAAVQAAVEAVRADKGPFPALRSAGQLGELRRADLRPLFREQLAHPNPDRRVQAIRGLARLAKDREDTEVLRGLVNDRELYAVVRASLNALRDWDAPGNRDVFAKATRMKSPRDLVRLAAHDALLKADADEGKERPDPDPPTTKVVKDCLSDIAKGVPESSVMTPQMRDSFIPRRTSAVSGWLQDLKSFTFLVRDDVNGQGVPRRGAAVGRVSYYKLMTGQATIFLAFHLTAEGRVADLDFTIE